MRDAQRRKREEERKERERRQRAAIIIQANYRLFSAIHEVRRRRERRRCVVFMSMSHTLMFISFISPSLSLFLLSSPLRIVSSPFSSLFPPLHSSPFSLSLIPFLFDTLSPPILSTLLLPLLSPPKVWTAIVACSAWPQCATEVFASALRSSQDSKISSKCPRQKVHSLSSLLSPLPSHS